MKELPLRKQPSSPPCLVCALVLAAAVHAGQAVRPQDDLHQFANADWLAATPLPPERVTVNASTELIDRVEFDLRALIEELVADEKTKRRADVRQAVNLYASMMNQAEVERLGLGPLRRDLDRINNIRTTRDLAATAGYLSSIAAGGPFEAIVSVEAVNLTVPTVRLLQGGTLLPDRSYYLDADPVLATVRRQYEEYLATIFRIAGREAPEQDAAAVLALETRLARAQLPPAVPGTPPSRNQVYPFIRLGQSFPGFDWRAWAEPQGVHHVTNLVIPQPAFFTSFAAMVPEVPIATWRAWLTGRYLTAMSPFVMSELASARFEFFGRILTGQQEPRPPWKRAVSLVSEFLGDFVGRRYVERHFSPASRDRVRAIAREVVDAYREAVREAVWMSMPARANAMRQLSTIRLSVGYPDRWRDYHGLDLKSDDLVGNIRRIRAFESRYRMERLREPADSGEWLMTPQTVNAYYSPAQHEVVVTAGILQPPFFDASEDDASNYGAIGAVIGHEISHALNLEDFRAGKGALAAQASGYGPLPGLRVNGAVTLPETLADLSGLSIAHRAYRRSLGGRPAPEVGGMTADQRFFTAWARMWRVRSRPEFVRSEIAVSRYAPWEFRANGLAQHLDAFHEAFNVKPGDRMYREPQARLRIW